MVHMHTLRHTYVHIKLKESDIRRCQNKNSVGSGMYISPRGLHQVMSEGQHLGRPPSMGREDKTQFLGTKPTQTFFLVRTGVSVRLLKFYSLVFLVGLFWRSHFGLMQQIKR